jgi:glycerophosphoryl diester phosphodiesterase
MNNFKVIGHRGSKAFAPENTLMSMKIALLQGCKWIECDVMLSKDKIPVIHHDNTIDRCTNGTGYLKDYTMEELEKLDAGSHFSSDMYKESIPSLKSLIDFCYDNDLGIFLEVKYLTKNCDDKPTIEEIEDEEELANTVCNIIEESNIDPSNLIFSTFSRTIIPILRKRLPLFKCSFICEDIPEDWEEFMILNNCYSLNFDYNSKNTSQELIRECCSNFVCYCYTVNNCGDIPNIISCGVSGVISDNPNIILEYLKNNY